MELALGDGAALRVGMSGAHVLTALATVGSLRSSERRASKPVPFTVTPWSLRQETYAASAVASMPPAPPGRP